MSTVMGSDRVQVNNRWVHCDGSNIGFLRTDGNWDMYTSNGGNVWTAGYGWLHDKFAYLQTRTISGQLIGRDGGLSSSVGSGNITNYDTYISYLTMTNSAGFDLYYTRRRVYSNCNCTCK